MYKSILVPIALDHAHDSQASLDIAKRLLAKGGDVTILTVVEQIPSYVSQYLPDGQMQKNLTDAAAKLKDVALSVPGAKTNAISGHAGTSITEYAAEKGNDLIIIASHRPGLQDYFLGSTAARVVRHAPCSVHVLR